MIDTQNKQQMQAYDLIANTNSSFFLTGRAGTGKTTFLRNVQKMVDKQFITLAPTGVAARWCAVTSLMPSTIRCARHCALRCPLEASR